MKLSDYVLFVAAGFALHQTAGLIGKMPEGWKCLAGYVIGVQGTLPAFVAMAHRLGIDNAAIIRASAAYQIAFLLIGIGVAGGWLVDSIFGIERNA